MPRICASTITSSAVVGSSAIRRLGSQHERERDHDPLPHAAGELVRVLLVAGGRDPHHPQGLERARSASPPCPGRARACCRVSRKWLSIVCSGIEAGHRLLEDQPEVGAAEIAQLLGVERRRCCGPHRAPRPRCSALLGQQAEEAAPERRLAAARLADQPEGLARGRSRSEIPSTARTGPPPVPYQTRRLRTSTTGSCSLTVHLVARSPPWRPPALRRAPPAAARPIPPRGSPARRSAARGRAG